MRTISRADARGLLSLILAFLLATSLLSGCAGQTQANQQQQEATNAEQAEEQATEQGASTLDLSSVPAYSGTAFIEVCDNEPQFTDADKARGSFEEYSELDSLGRCGVAFALVGTETMPTEKRGSIGSVKPSGWHTVRYDGVVEDNYLYNRCHLIGYQLTGENANPKNLITGTRYLNTEGMLPFEDEVANYVDNTGNHVLYRVTPIFEGDNLVASGVQMEAYSVEDAGAGVSFNIYCYNVQPGISIDYATGDSALAEDEASRASEEESSGQSYVLDTNTKRFHYPSCSSVESMKSSHRQQFTGTRQELIDKGYTPCGNCKP